MIRYKRHKPQGCTGCLFVFALIVLALGTAPLVFDLFGLFIFIVVMLVFSPIIAFLGISWYIKRQIGAYVKSQTESHNNFVFLLINILVNIARSDGKVTSAETSAISNFFRLHLKYSTSQLHWVRELMKEASSSTVSLDSLLTEFKKQFTYEPRLILLELVYQVMFSNETVSEQELLMLKNIAEYLGISAYDQQVVGARYLARSQHELNKEHRCYAVLGLKDGADAAEIKSAYRALSMKYHPDKVNHLGEEFRKVAEEKMKEINEAYYYLSKL